MKNDENFIQLTELTDEELITWAKQRAEPGLIGYLLSLSIILLIIFILYLAVF